MENSLAFNRVKSVIIFCVLLLVMSVAAPTFNITVNAQSASDFEFTEEEMEKVEEVAKQLEFIYEEASEVDNQGQIISINFNKIREKYGESEDLNQFEKEFTEFKDQQNTSNTMTTVARSSWTDCMVSSIVDFLGVSGTYAIGSGIKALITKKAWSAAAKAIVATVGTTVTVGAVAVTLAYYSVRCA